MRLRLAMTFMIAQSRRQRFESFWRPKTLLFGASSSKMATAVPIPANELAAWNAGGAAFIGRNLLQEGAAGQPQPSVTPSVNYPAANLIDYSFAHWTTDDDDAHVGSVSGTINPPAAVDTVIAYVYPQVAGGTASLSLDGVQLGQITGIDRPRRLIWSTPGMRYEDTSTVTLTLGGLMWPAELWAGRRLQLSQPFQPGWDDRPLMGESEDFVSPGRSRSQVIYSWGFQDHIGSFQFCGQDQFGLNDLQTLRTLQEESMGGARPVLMRPFAGDVWLLGRLGGIDRLALTGWIMRQWSMEFMEDAPPAFQERDGQGNPVNLPQLPPNFGDSGFRPFNPGFLP